MFLPWIKVEVFGYVDLLWQLAFNPPPAHSPPVHLPHHSPAHQQDHRGSGKPSHKTTQVSQVIPNLSTTRTRLFALFIGIDNYAHTKKLKGAVADARRMKDYMKHTFKLPDDQIRELLNDKASRENIIAEFRALANNDFKKSKIQPGDAILIYYAGHGDLIIAPTGWSSGRSDKKIQSIVPQDFCEGKVEVIPDRTIGSLVNMIAEKHGDNITIIFDCCHSGSGARKPDVTVRSADLENYSISPTLDAAIWQSGPEIRGMMSATGLAATGLESHILLTACSADEVAREVDDKGRFTTALLKVFNTTSPDQLTYGQVLDRLDPIPGQNPQLEGKNTHRIFFNAQANSPYRAYYGVYRDSTRGIILKAGEAHGICLGAEFTVYPDEEHLLLDPIVGVLVVRSVSPFDSIMVIAPDHRPFTLANPAVAIQTKAGKDQELKLHVPLEEEYLSVFQAVLSHMQGTGPNSRTIALVEDRSVANLGAVLREKKISFDILDTRLKEQGQLPIPHAVDAIVEAVLPVLEAAAHYYYHLNRTQINALIQTHVTVGLFELVRSRTLTNEATGLPVLVPCGENLIVKDKISINICDHISRDFGFSIKNTSERDLFPNVFYFDNSNLNIASVFTTVAASQSKTDFPLPKGGELTLGYGSGGVPVQEFFITPGQDFETGYLKIFVSSKVIDLSNIPQPTPFTDDRGLRPKIEDPSDIWGSIFIPVFLTRHCDHR